MKPTLHTLLLDFTRGKGFYTQSWTKLLSRSKTNTTRKFVIRVNKTEKVRVTFSVRFLLLLSLSAIRRNKDSSSPFNLRLIVSLGLLYIIGSQDDFAMYYKVVVCVLVSYLLLLKQFEIAS